MSESIGALEIDQQAEAIVDALARAGVDFVACFPDTQISPLIRLLDGDERFITVTVSREDEAVGVASGAYFGGCLACVLIQNSGLLESLNDLLTVAVAPEIPLLLLIGYRGHFGELGWYHGPAGRVTEGSLDLLGIKYQILDDSRLAERVIRNAVRLAHSSSGPTAVLVTLDALSSRQ